MKTNNRILCIATIILLFGSYFRLHNLTSNPAWYTDEGTHIEIARHLIQGKDHYLGITESYLIAARLPLFEHFLAFWFRLVGVGMFSLRILTAFMGILTISLTARLVFVATKNVQFALSSMALISIYPFAVIYSRFGFSYNLTGLLIFLSLIVLLRYKYVSKRRHVIIASLILGLATLTDFIALSFIPVYFLIYFRYYRQTFFIASICITFPFVLYSIYELIQHPNIFIHDLTYTLARAGILPITTQFDNIWINFKTLFTTSIWFPLGLFGIGFIKNNPFRWILVWLVVIPILIIGRTVALYNLSAYYMIPFSSYLIIGCSALLVHGIPYIGRKICSSSTRITYLSTAMVLIVFCVTSLHLFSAVNTRFQVGIEHFLIEKEQADTIRLLFDYEKNNAHIITSPTLAWMFDAKVTDFQIASLSKGNSVHFPANLYPTRFAFEANISNTDYAIIDSLWRDWGTIHMPNVKNMLNTIQQTWTIVSDLGSIQIYMNPKT